MSEVKRYFALGAMLPGEGWGDGVYVLASDYDALQQQCRDLGDQRARWASNASELGDMCDALRAEVERLREIREIASQCAANGGYLSSADLIELRALLKK